MAARTPEQHEARRTAEEGPADSRHVRRRLTFGVAGDLADMPATLSPWQRAYEAWRAAGLEWGHGAPPRSVEQRPASRDAVRADPERSGAAAPETPSAKAPARSKPGVAVAASAPPAPPEPKATQPNPSQVPARPKPPQPNAVRPRPVKPDPHDVLVAGPPRPLPRPVMRSGPTRRLRARAAVAAGLAVVAGGVIFAVSRGDDGPDGTGVPAPIAAGELFASDPAATSDGLVQDLTTIASAGATVVAAGTEGDGVPGREQTRFLVSADAGHAWSLARLRTADGSAVPPGDTPRLVDGGAGRWAALGRTSAGGVVAWTSEDAATWTRRPPAAGFTPSDQVNDLARTGQGFLAVGASGGRAVAWSSADGRAWQRVDAAGITAFDRVAASGNVVVAHGTYGKRVIQKRGKRKVTRTVRADGLWRSTDGGRTWTLAGVPQAQGSYGPTKGLAVGPGGFATVREGRQTTGRKKHRRTKRFGVLFTSADGARWQAVSRFGGTGVDRFDGTPSGLAVIVEGAKGAHTVLRSTDGRTWQPGGTVPAPVRGSGLTVANGKVAVSGRQGDDGYLLGVDLRTVPGAVHPERSVRSLAAAPGLSVAVGSTNGNAAIWTAPDGRAWKRAGFPATAGGLSDAVHGGRGWLAVGRVAGASSGPLAMTSQDGLTWQKPEFPAGPPPVAAAAGPAGYVAVGTGAAWRSADLRAWTRAGLDGAASDVAATSRAYVAVGGRGKEPAAWTSPDGLKWTAAKLPPGLAVPLTHVAAKGDTLVAIAGDAAALVSTDAGATWTRRDLGAGLAATAIAATPAGFVAAASAKDDAVVLASRDGTGWRRLAVPGLAGPGDQRLTALTAMGSTVLATGTETDSPILWRAPAPG
ncbi:sialidase family protein [Actinomadura sp. K4S16]|uniref:sialidase family protein n=1 Tax=Actinomadura sp. K4S16 TaxID=1316147 RepID=UPI0011F02905|nr:sialidase family protein [Actinomadura sp. K4S16]